MEFIKETSAIHPLKFYNDTLWMFIHKKICRNFNRVKYVWTLFGAWNEIVDDIS
jgi:hypothetical protein